MKKERERKKERKKRKNERKKERKKERKIWQITNLPNDMKLKISVWDTQTPVKKKRVDCFFLYQNTRSTQLPVHGKISDVPSAWVEGEGAPHRYGQDIGLVGPGADAEVFGDLIQCTLAWLPFKAVAPSFFMVHLVGRVGFAVYSQRGV